MSFELSLNLKEYKWLVFTSKNAIDPFFNKYEFQNNKIAVIGNQTANKLKTLKLNADFIGSGKSASDFVIEFLTQLNTNENVLLILGNLAPDTIENALCAKVNVHRVNVYKTNGVKDVDQNVLSLVQTNQYDTILLTSPSAYLNLNKVLRNLHSSLRMISIGETTTTAIKSNYEQPLATSDDSSYSGLAYTTINYFKNNQKN